VSKRTGCTCTSARPWRSRTLCAVLARRAFSHAGDRVDRCPTSVIAGIALAQPRHEPKEKPMNKNGTTNLEDRMGSLKDSVRNLVDAGGERAGQIKERLVDAKDMAFDRGKEGINRVGALIKEHPIAAIGIAFGIGYLTVRMLRR
jgi:ElaB/YqjD/DUF883 family membrane-anchored ribosome-binding protein